MHMIRLISILATLSVAACSSAEGDVAAARAPADGTTGGGATAPDIDPPGPAGCKRGVMEADFAPVGAMKGPGLDPATGQLGALPKGALISSTYLAMKLDPAGKSKFAGLLSPILKVVPTQPGLLAYQFGFASACGTARTLTVWKDEAAMLAFVMSPVHTAAMKDTAEVSRGGSVVTTWEPQSPTDATWEKAAEELAATYGPYY
jgi:quinol monooxygenase YgiN